MDEFRQDILERIKSLQSRDDRIGKIEQEQASIVTSLKSMAQSFEQLATEVRQMKDSARTDWKLIVGGVAVTISILTFLGNLALNPIRDTQTSYHKDIGKVLEMASANSTGLALITSQVSANTNDLNSRKNQRFNQPHHEYFIQHVYERDISRIDDEIERLRNWKMNHDKGVIELNSYQSAQIKNIESQLEHIRSTRYTRDQGNAMEHRMEKMERHADELGHPHMQTEMLRSLKDDLSSVSSEQKRRSIANNWRE